MNPRADSQSGGDTFAAKIKDATRACEVTPERYVTFLGS